MRGDTRLYFGQKISENKKKKPQKQTNKKRTSERIRNSLLRGGDLLPHWVGIE